MQTEPQSTLQTIHLDEIAQVALTVTDLDRATRFYRDALGMQFLFNAGSMAFFQCGSIRFMIGLAEAPVTPAGTIIYFKVPDIHAVHAALAEQGITILHPPHRIASMPGHDLWLAFFADPDGNAIGVLGELPPGV